MKENRLNKNCMMPSPLVYRGTFMKPQWRTETPPPKKTPTNLKKEGVYWKKIFLLPGFLVTAKVFGEFCDVMVKIKI